MDQDLRIRPRAEQMPPFRQVEFGLQFAKVVDLAIEYKYAIPQKDPRDRTSNLNKNHHKDQQLAAGVDGHLARTPHTADSAHRFLIPDPPLANLRQIGSPLIFKLCNLNLGR